MIKKIILTAYGVLLCGFALAGSAFQPPPSVDLSIYGAQISTNTKSLNALNGTQVAASALTENATTAVYTVTAGKSLYLSTAYMSQDNAAGDCAGFMNVTTDGDVEVYKIFYNKHTSLNTAQSLSFVHPLKIQSGYKIKVVNACFSIYTFGFISGWEE